jgi:tetratricopeptide (TPR) repeat protein
MPLYQPAPNMGGYVAPPLTPAPVTRQLPRGDSALARPFPVWLTVATPLVMLVTLGIVSAAALLLFDADWAGAAVAASLVAFGLAAVIVIVLIIRVIAGRRALGSVALSALLALALVAGGASAIGAKGVIHSAQAKQLEAASQWQAAISEYAQSGEAAPNAPDVARVYDEWGEALAKSGDYAGAVSKLTTVNKGYGDSGAPFTRARADLYTTYVAWIQSGATDIPYEQALAFFASYTVDPACDTSCQSAISDVSAQAHYQYGQQLASAGQYQQAITEFELVQSQYATSQYAKPAHAAAATSYLTLANQTLTQDCQSTLPMYQTLAKNYGDTPEGKKAKSKLAARVTVTLILSAAPNNPPPTAYLSLSINGSQDYFSDNYRGGRGANGAYTFNGVAPGKYFVNTVRVTSAYIAYVWWYNSEQGHDPFAIGPICPTNLGQFDYPSGY